MEDQQRRRSIKWTIGRIADRAAMEHHAIPEWSGRHLGRLEHALRGVDAIEVPASMLRRQVSQFHAATGPQYQYPPRLRHMLG
ncbi:hypothetical protein D3C87_2011440 [compost metagenome]